MTNKAKYATIFQVIELVFMANYFYRCKSNNKIINGYVFAQNMQDAAKKLEAQGYILLELKEEKNPNADFSLRYEAKPFNIKEKKDFFNSFYRQYKAGIPSLEIFQNIITTSSSDNIKTLCFNITRNLQKNTPFQDVIERYKHTIGEVEAALIAAGYKSGKLEKVLYKITKNIEQQEKIKSALISQLTYPAIVFNLILFSGLVFIFFVFPIFQSFSSGDDLCITNLIITALTKIAVIFAIAYFLVFCVWKNKTLTKKFTSAFCNIAYIKDVLKSYYFSNFFYTFSLAYEAGLSIPSSIELSNKTINAKEINAKIQKAQNMTKEGCEISTALGVAGIFSDYAVSQISNGEKTGELANTLNDIARDYQESCNTKTSALLKTIEPIMIIIAAIFIFIIAIKFYNGYFKTLFSYL